MHTTTVHKTLNESDPEYFRKKLHKTFYHSKVHKLKVKYLKKGGDTFSLSTKAWPSFPK